MKISPVRRILTRNIYGKVLDVGCGAGSCALLYYNLIKQCQYIVGCDLHFPKLKRAKTVYDDVVYCDVQALPFIEKKLFDVVTAFEIVEHLLLPSAMKFITTLERLGSRVVITTVQESGIDLSSKDLNSHRCLIPPKVFKERGYKVRGTVAKRGMRSRWLYRLFKLWCYFFPSSARDIIAIK